MENSNFKIFITGDPGTGKSTTAIRLHEHLNIPVFHTDTYMTKDASTYNPYKVFLARVKKILDENTEYIIDGSRFGKDNKLFTRIANDANLILDFDFPTKAALENWLKRTEEIMQGKAIHTGINMGEDYGSPKFFKFFLEYYAGFIGEKENRKSILENLAPKVIKLRSFKDVDKTLDDLTTPKN